MKRSLSALVPAALFATLAGCASLGAFDPPSETSIAAHVQRAKNLAGDDVKPLLRLCEPAPPRMSPEEGERYISTQIARTPPAPGQAFDNLYYVGGAWASAWVLSTSAGLILIDALNNTLEAQALIEGGMRKLGLDPAQIKFIVVTHGHGDHYGGAKYLQERYQASVVMSQTDWTMLETRLEFASRFWDAPPKRGLHDRAVKAGDTLTLGDTTLVFHETPGHTLGTLSPAFPVRTGGRSHRAFLWGGTSFNFGNDLPRMQKYVDAARSMGEMARVEGIDVMLSNHPSFDSTVEKLAALRKAGAGSSSSHPFVMGNDAVVRSLGVMQACARAQYDRFALAPKAP